MRDAVLLATVGATLGPGSSINPTTAKTKLNVDLGKGRAVARVESGAATMRGKASYGTCHILEDTV